MPVIRDAVALIMTSEMDKLNFFTEIMNWSLTLEHLLKYQWVENFMDFANQLLNSSVGRRL